MYIVYLIKFLKIKFLLNISQCLGLEQVFPPDLSNREQSYIELETAGV